MTLRSLTKTDRVVVRSFSNAQAGQLLMSMGLLPGDVVELERQAPFDGPMVFRSGQLIICMRPEEAATVHCEPVSPLVA